MEGVCESEPVCVSDGVRDNGSDSEGGGDSALRRTFGEALRRRVGEPRFATWFGGAVRIAVVRENGQRRPTVRLSAPSGFELGLLRKQFADDVRAAAADVLGEGAGVAFVVAQGADRVGAGEATADPDASASTPAAVLTPSGCEARRPAEVVGRGLAPAEKSTFRTPASEVATRDADDPPQPATCRAPSAPAVAGWVEGPCNAAATHLCRRVLSGGMVGSPALIWGPAGVGKSHLLRVLRESALRRKQRFWATSAEGFLRGFVEAARSDRMPQFRGRFAEADLLLVDDVHHLAGKARTLEEFRHAIDSAADRGAAVVLTADRGPSELRDLGPEIASRLAGGLSVEVAMPHPTVRCGLVRQAAERAGFELPQHVARALANHLIGGGREAQGAVHRLALMHETLGLQVDERLAQRVADESNRLSTPPVRLSDIQRAVCGVFGVDAKTLRSDKRTKAVTEPRTLAMWLARKLTGSAWSEIGDHFGRKSHSTVIAAHRRVERLLASSTPTQLSVGELGETIRRVEAALRSA